METFRLPASDERFLRLTTLEALEQVMLVTAVGEWRAELRKRRQGAHYDDTRFESEVEVKTDEEAADLADTAHLDGDPENDEIELAETAPGGTDWRAEYESFLEERGYA